MGQAGVSTAAPFLRSRSQCAGLPRSSTGARWGLATLTRTQGQLWWRPPKGPPGLGCPPGISPGQSILNKSLPQVIHSCLAPLRGPPRSPLGDTTVPFSKMPLRGHNRKVFGQRRPRPTLWVPSGPMGPQTTAKPRARFPEFCIVVPPAEHDGAVRPVEPVRVLPSRRGSRQPGGPFEPPPLVDLALAVSVLARAAQKCVF